MSKDISMKALRMLQSWKPLPSQNMTRHYTVTTSPVQGTLGHSDHHRLPCVHIQMPLWHFTDAFFARFEAQNHRPMRKNPPLAMYCPLPECGCSPGLTHTEKTCSTLYQAKWLKATWTSLQHLPEPDCCPQVFHNHPVPTTLYSYTPNNIPGAQDLHRPVSFVLNGHLLHLPESSCCPQCFKITVRPGLKKRLLSNYCPVAFCHHKVDSLSTIAGKTKRKVVDFRQSSKWFLLVKRA